MLINAWKMDQLDFLEKSILAILFFYIFNDSTYDRETNTLLAANILLTFVKYYTINKKRRKVNLQELSYYKKKVNAQQEQDFSNNKLHL